MPIYKTQVWKPVPIPDNLDLEQEVFVIKFTGEIFLSYDEFIARMEWYMERNWVCDRTGRNGITLECAVESEKTATALVSYIPACLEAFVLRFIQGNTLKLDQLIHKLYDSLRSKPEANVFISNYKISFCKDVLRQFLRDNTYRKVSISGSPFILKESVATQHHIDVIQKFVSQKSKHRARTLEKSNSPDNNNKLIHKVRPIKLLSSKAQITQKIDEKLETTLINIDSNFLIECISSFHNCPNTNITTNSINLLQISDIIESDPLFPVLNINCQQCSSTYSLGRTVRPIDDDQYPKQDENLLKWERILETPKPHPTIDPLLSSCGSDLLYSYHFLQTFSEVIQLTRFPLKDLEEGFAWEKVEPSEAPCNLIQDIFIALVRFLLHNASGRLGGILHYNLGSYKSVSKLNWEKYVKGYVRGCIRVYDESQGLSPECPNNVNSILREYVSNLADINDTTYKLLSISCKLNLMFFFCDHVGQYWGVKQYIDQSANHLHEVRSRLYEERLKVCEENRENQNDTSESSLRLIDKLSCQSKLLQNHVKSFSIQSLGQDRDFNTYWYLPSVNYRIYIEHNTDSSWTYYGTVEHIESLMCYLNEKGEREFHLKENISKIKNELFEAIKNYFNNLKSVTEIRRSMRMAAMLKQKPSYMSYVNIYNKEEY